MGTSTVSSDFYNKTFPQVFKKNILFLCNFLSITGRDPTALPPVYLDAYKIPNAENLQDKRFQWFAVLAWVGRKPNLKFCSNKDELVKSRYYK